MANLRFIDFALFNHPAFTQYTLRRKAEVQNHPWSNSLANWLIMLKAIASGVATAAESPNSAFSRCRN